MSNERDGSKPTSEPSLPDLPERELTDEQADGLRGGLDAAIADGSIVDVSAGDLTTEARDAASGQASGKRSWAPIRI